MHHINRTDKGNSNVLGMVIVWSVLRKEPPELVTVNLQMCEQQKPFSLGMSHSNTTRHFSKVSEKQMSFWVSVLEMMGKRSSASSCYYWMMAHWLHPSWCSTEPVQKPVNGINKSLFLQIQDAILMYLSFNTYNWKSPPILKCMLDSEIRCEKRALWSWCNLLVVITRPWTQ